MTVTLMCVSRILRYRFDYRKTREEVDPDSRFLDGRFLL